MQWSYVFFALTYWSIAMDLNKGYDLTSLVRAVEPEGVFVLSA